MPTESGKTLPWEEEETELKKLKTKLEHFKKQWDSGNHDPILVIRARYIKKAIKMIEDDKLYKTAERLFK